MRTILSIYSRVVTTENGKAKKPNGGVDAIERSAKVGSHYYLWAKG